MSTIEVIPLGPSDGSEGHAFSVRVNGEPRALLDAGGPHDGAEPSWVEEGAAHDVVWISHGHYDHAGSLPWLLHRRPRLDVVLPASAAPIALQAALAAGVDPSRARALFDNARTVEFHRDFDLAGFACRCGPSGHGAGAGLLRLEHDDGAIGYTSDWALHERRGIRSAATELLQGVDLLIAEAALSGAARLDDWIGERERARILEFLDSDGPRIVAVSPLAELEELHPLLSGREDLVWEAGLEPFVGSERLGTFSRCERHLESGGMVVAAGSSLEATEAAGALAIPHVTGPRVHIALFNHVPAGSTAARLLHTSRRAKRTVYGATRRIRAHIERFDLPTHATRPDLVRTLVDLAPDRLLLFHHSRDALADLTRALIAAGSTSEVAIATAGEPFEVAR